MKLPSQKDVFVRDFLQWLLCVVNVMCVQIVIIAVADFLSIDRLTWILELFYVPPMFLLGMFFEDQTFLGNIPLGLALLFLTVMVFSVVLGTVFYAGNKLYDKYMSRKNKQE